jgi:hypothetical protein
MAESDLSRVFGIDLAGSTEASATEASPGRRSRAGSGATAAGKAAVRKAVGSNAAKNKKLAQGMKSKSSLKKKLTAKKG